MVIPCTFCLSGLQSKSKVEITDPISFKSSRTMKTEAHLKGPYPNRIKYSEAQTKLLDNGGPKRSC